MHPDPEAQMRNMTDAVDQLCRCWRCADETAREVTMKLVSEQLAQMILNGLAPAVSDVLVLNIDKLCDELVPRIAKEVIAEMHRETARERAAAQMAALRGSVLKKNG